MPIQKYPETNGQRIASEISRQMAEFARYLDDPLYWIVSSREDVRKATLKVWGLLKLNDHLIYEERAKRWLQKQA